MYYSATCSPCEQYRYVLSRIWAEDIEPCIFIMLNPSTADAHQDDPTIRRVMAFAAGFGFGGVHILNLFAIRGADPSIIKESPAPVGADNQDWWCKTLCKVEEYAVEPTVICGWGVHGGFRDRDLEALHWLSSQQIKGPYCLGQTKAGFPKHPLYISKTAEMERYRTTRSRKR